MTQSGRKPLIFELGLTRIWAPGPRRIIEYDYGMINGEKVIAVRKNSLLYFYRKMGFHMAPGLSTAEQQVILLNPEEIEIHMPMRQSE